MWLTDVATIVHLYSISDSKESVNWLLSNNLSLMTITSINFEDWAQREALGTWKMSCGYIRLNTEGHWCMQQARFPLFQTN